MSFFSIFKSIVLWKHISIQVLIFIIVLFSLYFWLSSYTYHNISITVPSLIGMSFDDAKHIANSHNLKVVLSDSVHFSDKPKGTVVSQVPDANEKVKPERTIYVIINGFENEKISMPDLRGISLRQAIADAELFGLKIGNLTYVPDISTTVLKQLYKGKEIAPGTLINKDAVIDLVIGKGISNEKTDVICVIGKTLEEAQDILSKASLNIGIVSTDETITSPEDSLKAFIWKQIPKCDYQIPISLGSYIDVWITLDKDLLPSNSNELILSYE